MRKQKIYSVYKKLEHDQILNVRECQNHLLDMFKRFIQFCNDSNVSVFLLWGTLLGAKRGGKIIPWDDDIDLGISPDDFARLLELKDKLPNYGLKLIHYSNNSHIHSNEIRIFEDGFYEMSESSLKTYLKPVYIDIFPYCRVSSNNKTSNLISKIRRCTNKLIVKETKWKSTSLFKAFLRFLYKCILVFSSSYSLHKRIDKYVGLLYDGSNDYELTFPDTFHNAKINYFYKDSFERLVNIDFEGIKCLAPEKACEILTIAYGDWEKPKDRSGGKILEKKYLLRSADVNS